MEDIKIGGYTLAELKVVQNAVRKDANKIISDAIQTATDNMEALLQFDGEGDEPYTEEDKEKILALAKEAGEALELADVIATVSGMEYNLPYCTDWDNDGFFHRFESADNEELFELIDENSKVFGKLEDMEYQSRKWNQSTC